MEKEFITPAKAREYLEINDPDNRPIDESKVTAYRGAMERGEWTLRVPIGISHYRGDLMDGQHRMKALATANVEGVWFYMQKG